MDYGGRRGGGRGGGGSWGRGGGGGGGGWGDSSNSYMTQEMYVPQSLVGRIIGKGGSKIRELEDISGAGIKVNSREAENGQVRVDISGSDDSRSRAEELINDISATFSDMSRGGGGGGRYGGGGGGGGSYGRQNYGGRRNFSCYSCGEEGHMSRNCSSGGSGGQYSRGGY